MKRYIYLAIGTIAMVIYGLMYNWTVFSPQVQVDLQVSAASLANVFSICQIFLTLGGLVSGFIYYRINYRLSMIITSLMMGAGLLITSFATNTLAIYFFYSFCYTFGAGYAYKSLLTAIMTWFPDKSGLASGILLMGAGLTAFIFNVPMTYLIESFGWRSAMMILALIAFVITFIAGIIVVPTKSVVIKNESHEELETIDDVPTKTMLKSNKFWLYFIWSILVMAGCTTIIGNAVNCGISFGISATVAAALSMIISLFNSVSRIFYGYIYDKMGRKVTMGIATVFFAFSISLLFIAFMSSSTLLLSISFIFIGLTFGAVPTISNIYILKTFGPKYYPSNFSIQYLYSLISSFAGTMLFSLFFSITQTYSISCSFIIVYVIIAIALYLALNKVLKTNN